MSNQTYKLIFMTNLLFLGNIGAGEIVLIALVVLLLFGGKKIPELMKGLGKGVKSFKEGMNEIEKDLNDDAPKANNWKKTDRDHQISKNIY